MHNLQWYALKFTVSSYFNFTFYAKKINIKLLKKGEIGGILLKCTIMGSLPVYIYINVRANTFTTL